MLAYIAYVKPVQTRAVRAAQARIQISEKFSSKQQVFLEFELQHNVNVGVEELDRKKLSPLLRLKYHDSITDAVADLGHDIGDFFAEFQQYQQVHTGAYFPYQFRGA